MPVRHRPDRRTPADSPRRTDTRNPSSDPPCPLPRAGGSPRPLRPRPTHPPTTGSPGRTQHRTQNPETHPMKITGYELFLVEPRWLFLRIDTDEGISGWGEPIVEGKAHTVARRRRGDVRLPARPGPRPHRGALAGPGQERLLPRRPVLTSALAGIDQALWDIAGKTHGVPVHQLLGGHVRDRVRIYGWVGGETPAETGRIGGRAGRQGLDGGQAQPLRPAGAPRHARRDQRHRGRR